MDINVQPAAMTQSGERWTPQSTGDERPGQVAVALSAYSCLADLASGHRCRTVDFGLSTVRRRPVVLGSLLLPPPRGVSSLERRVGSSPADYLCLLLLRVPRCPAGRDDK